MGAQPKASGGETDIAALHLPSGKALFGILIPNLLDRQLNKTMLEVFIPNPREPKRTDIKYITLGRWLEYAGSFDYMSGFCSKNFSTDLQQLRFSLPVGIGPIPFFDVVWNNTDEDLKNLLSVLRTPLQERIAVDERSTLRIQVKAMYGESRARPYSR